MAEEQVHTSEPKEQTYDLREEEEVTEGSWIRPQVEVNQVDVVTGEELEEVFWSHRAKLYRWFKPEGDPDTGEWKERGLGEAKLLRHKENGKIRFLLRQEKTMKIVANHYVVKFDKYCELVANVSSDKIWVWTVNDHSEGETTLEQFALRFGQLEQATIFKDKFEEACKINAELFEASKAADPAPVPLEVEPENKDGTKSPQCAEAEINGNTEAEANKE
eukprot:GHVP01038886.1.p1 GENE.GHVP01038886.1~~GHVP01038886.1.p1  ORF type:complete len:219 (+),score=53.68 GHVP01038886.1:698-1354(+)